MGASEERRTWPPIQKFLINFIELKKREASQLKHIKKIIDDFRSNLVEFKKSSRNPNDYQIAERSASASDIQPVNRDAGSFTLSKRNSPKFSGSPYLCQVSLASLLTDLE